MVNHINMVYLKAKECNDQISAEEFAIFLAKHFTSYYKQAETKILGGPHEDLEGYLEAIDKLRSNIKFFNSIKSTMSTDGVLNQANSLPSKALSMLEEEFKDLLSSYSNPVEPERLFECLPSSLRPSSDSPDHHGTNDATRHSEDQPNSEADLYKPPTCIPPRILLLLHDLSEQMIEAGHGEQLLKIYRTTRSTVLEESLCKLGVEKLSRDDVQKMQWEILEAKIWNWIGSISCESLFEVCDQMFEGFDSLRDQCFAESTANSVSMLLSFGDAIARSKKRSPEKLFVLLDMYEIMRELQSEIEAGFRGKECGEIRESALGLTKRLAQTAQETFGDFEEAVDKDATKTAVLDGTVHPPYKLCDQLCEVSF